MIEKPNGPATVNTTSNGLVSRCVTVRGRQCIAEGVESHLGDWTGRLLALFMSIKNRKFNRELIDWFIGVCEAEGHQGLICSVDEPYVYNRMADLAVTDLPDTEVATIRQLSEERARMVRKALNGSRGNGVRFTSWQELSDGTPAWMKDEIRAAWESRGMFAEDIRKHVRLLKKIDDNAVIDRYAEFFLCETPVLIASYYRPGRGLVDVYPGANADVFRNIELGCYESEMPQTTKYARAGRPLIYLDTDPDAEPSGGI